MTDPTAFEDDVRRMLGRRAADVPDDLDPASGTGPSTATSSVTSAGADRRSPGRTLEPAGRSPAPPRRRPTWMAAAALIVVAAVALVAWGVTRDDESTVVTAPEVVEAPPAPGPPALLTVGVNLQQPWPSTNEPRLSLVITDAAGDPVGEPLLAGAPAVYDSGAEPGSFGNDLVTRFPEMTLPGGDYRLEVQVAACADGCGDGAPEPTYVCRGDLHLEAPGASTFFRIRSGLGATEACQGPASFSEEWVDAAGALFDRLKSTGWVPYDGDEVIAGFPTPDDAWVPYGFGAQPGCDRPATLGAEVELLCVFDAPAGNVIGYAVSNLGFVPTELIGAIDVDGELVDRFGCNPQQEDGCIQRWLAEQHRVELERTDLSDDERRAIESELADLEAYLERPRPGG